MDWSENAPPDPIPSSERPSDGPRSLADRLPAKEAARLLAEAAQVSLAPRQVLSHGQEVMEHVYFVETGLVSIMAKANKQRWVEGWMVGAEGLVGLSALAAGGRPPHRCVVQIGGTALRIPTDSARSQFESSAGWRALALEQLGFQLLQASQIGACNAQHSALQRVARWLLLAADERRGRSLPLSQDMVARAVGLRRATVSDCLQLLETRGAIKTTRRLIEIANAEAMRSCSCDCYRIIARGRPSASSRSAS